MYAEFVTKILRVNNHHFSALTPTPILLLSSGKKEVTRYMEQVKKMYHLHKRALLLSLLVIIAAGSVIGAFIAIQYNATINVKEPLSVSGTPTISGGSCTVNGLTVTCTTTVFAGDRGTTNITVANAANRAINITVNASANSTDITGSPTPLSQIAPAGGTTIFELHFEVSQTAPAGEVIRVTLTFSR